MARTGLASTLMGAAVAGIRTLSPGVGLLVTGVGGLALGATTYIIAVIALGNGELREPPGLLLNKQAASLPGTDALAGTRGPMKETWFARPRTFE